MLRQHDSDLRQQQLSNPPCSGRLRPGVEGAASDSCLCAVFFVIVAWLASRRGEGEIVGRLGIDWACKTHRQLVVGGKCCGRGSLFGQRPLEGGCARGRAPAFTSSPLN